MAITYRAKDRGVASVELALSIGVAITALVYILNTWAGTDFEHSMWRSASAAVHDTTVFVPYSSDSTGIFPLDETTQLSSATGMSTLINRIYTNLKQTQGMADSAKNVRCIAQVGYLSLNEGNVQTSGHTILSPVIAADPGPFGSIGAAENAELLALVNSAANSFIARMAGQSPPAKILPPTSNVQLYPGDPSSQTVNYFNYSAFVSWGCAGTSKIVGSLGANAKSAGIMTPTR